MQSRRQESGDSLVLEISISACETSHMGRKPLIGILLLQFVCVSVSVCLCEAWHLSEMLNAGFDHLLHNVLNENWFPLIADESFLS